MKTLIRIISFLALSIAAFADTSMDLSTLGRTYTAAQQTELYATADGTTSSGGIVFIVTWGCNSLNYKDIKVTLTRKNADDSITTIDSPALITNQQSACYSWERLNSFPNNDAPKYYLLKIVAYNPGTTNIYKQNACWVKSPSYTGSVP